MGFFFQNPNFSIVNALFDQHPQHCISLFLGCQSGKALLWDIRKARNCLMSFDMGHLKGRDKKRGLEASLAHKGSVNGLGIY